MLHTLTLENNVLVIFSCHDLNSWDIWDDIFHIIKSGNDSQGIPEEVAIYRCSYLGAHLRNSI